MAAQLSDRWRLTLPLAIPSLGGLAYLFAFDAPLRLIAVNAGALGLALAWVVMGRLPSGPKARLGLTGLALTGLFLPPLLHHDVGGVARWLPIGPFMLHSGGLLLPLLGVLAAREARTGPWILALAMLALVLQPDAGSLLGVAATGAALAWAQRSTAFTLVAGASLTLALAMWHAGTLEPQEFTEGVLTQVWQSAPLFALVLAALVFLAPPGLLLREEGSRRTDGYALAAALIGLAVAAVLAPFPFPLIGYGASSILGFGLALGVMAATPHTDTAFRPSA